MQERDSVYDLSEILWQWMETNERGTKNLFLTASLFLHFPPIPTINANVTVDYVLTIKSI